MTSRTARASGAAGSADPVRPHRGTILLEDTEVLAHQPYPGEQYILRVRAPRIAARARPGSFVHVQCDPALPMRRPMSLMRVSPDEGWVQLLYKVVGEGSRLLAMRRVGERLSMLGPIGRTFELHSERPRPLLLGGGVGIPPMVFLADTLRTEQQADWRPFVVMGSEVPFPFRTRPSTIMVSGVPDGVIATMPLLEDWGIATRLASLQGYSGCFDGYVTELANHWLDALDPAQREQVEVFGCGPEPMLESVAKLARDHDLPCQLSLEEFMACAVGGCAGCTVKVATPDGPAMKRVCVDGPVFDARAIYPA